MDNNPGNGTAGQAAEPTGVKVEDALEPATFENGLGQVPQVTRETTPDAIEIADLTQLISKLDGYPILAAR